MTDKTQQAALITPVLVAACIIIIVSFGVRATFGVFQIPVAEEFGWARTEFSLAIAIQNLAWGVGQPIFGALAEKIGDRKAIVLGALVYVLGLVLTAYGTTPLEHQAYAWLVGFGVAGTGFGVVLAVVARAAAPEHRSMALAIVSAMGSVGQIFGPPIAEYLLGSMTWQSVFLIFAVAVLLTLLTLPMIRTPEPVGRTELEETLGQVVGRAFRDPTYFLIFIGFFACGYQVAFITAHFPALVTEMCGPLQPGGLLYSLGIQSTSALGAIAISLIGLANIAGTLTAGWLGNRFSKKYLLSAIYAGRTVIAGAFFLFPMTPETVILFSVSMGLLWLATIPLTSGLVAHIYGVRYMGTLYGFVFLSHQIGSFLGVWMGGALYDIYGDYTAVWWIGVAVGAFSAIVHLPIRESPLGIKTAAAN